MPLLRLLRHSFFSDMVEEEEEQEEQETSV